MLDECRCHTGVLHPTRRAVSVFRLGFRGEATTRPGLQRRHGWKRPLSIPKFHSVYVATPMMAAADIRYGFADAQIHADKLRCNGEDYRFPSKATSNLLLNRGREACNFQEH